jgi:hypothetical protein
VAVLLRLARLGHAQGLHAALDRLVADHPGLAPQADVLRELVERFAFNALIDMLRASVHEDDDEIDDDDENDDQEAVA